MKKDLKFYRTLFISTFSLSAFTFGGGYVIVPLMRKKFVEKLKWIDEEEMINLIAISQSSPGAIAVNTSILVGYKLAGIPGALISTLGTVLPPLIILTTISFVYNQFKDNAVVNAALKGMQAGIAAVIIDVVYDLAAGIIKKKRAVSAIIMLGAFIAAFWLDINVAFIILASGAIGAAMVIYRERKRRRV